MRLKFWNKIKSLCSCRKSRSEEMPPIEVCSQTICEEESVSYSLLDNTQFMTLAQQCCDMIGELDRMQKQIKDETLIEFIIMQKSRIREALVLSNATLIDGETEFNLLRHQLLSGSIGKNGTPISETIEAGVEIENRVMIKAKVVI